MGDVIDAEKGRFTFVRYNTTHKGELKTEQLVCIKIMFFLKGHYQLFVIINVFLKSLMLNMIEN